MRYLIQQITPESLLKEQEAFRANRREEDTQEADLGLKEAGTCFAAISEGKTIGAAWAWNLENDNQPAETYIFVLPECRSMGIGTDLMKTLTDYLALCGYPELYATVRRDNYAVLLFGSTGFRPIKEVDEVYTLRLDLASVGQIDLG